MAAYKDLVGQKITKVTSNPGEPKTGQMWYNSTTGTLKGLGIIEAWASAANQTQVQRDGGFGQSTPSSASWFAGGVDASRNSTTTQEWNGTGWSNGGNINVGREETTGFGLVDAAALAGGSTYPPSALKNEVEEYNGSSWTAVTALPAKRKQAAGAGTQTAGLVSFGAVDPPSATGSINATALEYDGSSWTSGSSGSEARSQISGCGTQTAGIVFGGHTSPSTTYPGKTEEYDGSSWTTGGTMNTNKGLMACNGIQTSALAYAGFQPYKNTSEKYDGTTWSNTPTLSTARDRAHGGGPNSSNGLCAGGLTSPGVVSVVEEFTSSTNIITAAAWASGNNLNSARYQMAGAGTQTAGLAFGGYEPGGETGKTEEYDGTSWSEQNDMGTARYEMGNGNGTQTAALCSAGRTDTAYGGGAQAFVEEYDGTSWSEVNNLPGNRTAHGSAGPQTASIIALGKSAPPAPSVVDTSLHYDGTNWTSGGTANTARFAAFGAGTQTSAIFAGGNPSLATAEEYNGSAWTTTGSLIAGAQGPSAAGADSDAALFTSGGNGGSGSGVAQTSLYNGTVFVSAPQLANERGYAAGFGIQTSAVVAAGLRSTGVTTTEEFTGETTAANIKNFTTS